VALSIMFLAAGLASGGRSGERLTLHHPWVFAIAFGLLHGLGFAGELREIGLPEADVPLPLFAFNLRVEAGQLMFIAVVLAVGALPNLPPR
jgi:hypothetical protein